MEVVETSRKEQAKVSRPAPGADSGLKRECAVIIHNALGSDDELGRDAASSLAGYGGRGGGLPGPGDQNQVNKRHERATRPVSQSYVGEGPDGGERKGGAEDTNGHGRTDGPKEVNCGLPSTGDSEPYHEHRPLQEETGGTDEPDEPNRKPLKSKLKDLLPGHHDHTNHQNGSDGGLVEMPKNEDEKDHGVLSKLKHKIEKTHEKHLDGLAPEAWG